MAEKKSFLNKMLDMFKSSPQKGEKNDMSKYKIDQTEAEKLMRNAANKGDSMTKDLAERHFMDAYKTNKK